MIFRKKINYLIQTWSSGVKMKSVIYLVLLLMISCNTSDITYPEDKVQVKNSSYNISDLRS